MTPRRARAAAILAPLRVFAAMLAGMVVLPAVRPLFAARGASESSMHMFMSINMLGAAVLTPLIALAADKSGRRTSWLAALALADAVLILGCAAKLPIHLVMALRALQGAANVGALTLAMADDGPGPASSVASGRAWRGAAMMAAIVAGPLVGGALLALGPEGPFGGAAVAAVLVSASSLGPQDELDAPVAPRHSMGLRRVLADAPLLVVPAAIAFAERFTVGCFVVTFALRAHGVLAMSDRQISLGYSLFLIPFALGMYPAALTARWVSRPKQLAIGAVAYAGALVAFGTASGVWLALALVIAGLASAAMYAPTLSYASTLSPEGAPSTGMALFHAAGCVGMTLGPAAAGILSAILRAAGAADATRYGAVFALAAGALLAVVAALRGRLRTLARRESPATPARSSRTPSWAPLPATTSSFPSRPPRRA